jgi:E3 ubiquitin-protein ligase BIG BROTHER-like protein
MATPTTYSVRVSSETHKVEEWLTSDEALAWQLQEEENTRDAAADTRESAGTAPLTNSFASFELIPLAVVN